MTQVHILAIEYPGYGVYKGKPSEENILRDAEIVYDYLVDYLEIKESQIIILGKSLGTGPSTHLAAHRNPRALILVTPYTSIRECVGDLMGFLSKYLIAERFRNIDKIGKVRFLTFVNRRFNVLYVFCMGRKTIQFLTNIR